MLSKQAQAWAWAWSIAFASLKKSETWILVERLSNQKIVGSELIFKRKECILGIEDPRYKIRLVAKGFTLKEGDDYKEIFSLVVKHTSIRNLDYGDQKFDLELGQIDIRICSSIK